MIVVRLIIMDSFPDLRTFLLLRDPIDTRYNKSAFCSSTTQLGYRRGYNAFEVAVHVYDVAKANWERFGDDGPPLGTMVQMLESGHCGSAGALRIMAGVFERDPRFFQVRRSSGDVSLVVRNNWWLHMRVYEKDDFFDKEMC
jgi:hypothetical protein